MFFISVFGFVLVYSGNWRREISNFHALLTRILKFASKADAKRKICKKPSKNACPLFAPSRMREIFTHNA
jgi:hypothetical protein